VKLNLGCARSILDGYENIDTDPCDERVINMNILDLQYPEDSIDEIIAKDIIEHLSLQQAHDAILHWGKLCKSGAQIYIQTTNFPKMISAYQSGVWNIGHLCYMLFAGRNWSTGDSKPEDWHKSTYDLKTLSGWLSEAGFLVTKYQEDEIDDPLRRNPVSHNLNINIWAQKNDI